MNQGSSVLMRAITVITITIIRIEVKEIFAVLRLQQDLNPWPPWYRCDALQTELWSLTSQVRIQFIPNCMKRRCEVYMIKIIYMSELWIKNRSERDLRYLNQDTIIGTKIKTMANKQNNNPREILHVNNPTPCWESRQESCQDPAKIIQNPASLNQDPARPWQDLMIQPYMIFARKRHRTLT